MYRITRQWTASQTTWNRATSSVAWSVAGGDHYAAPESSWVATGAPLFVRGNVMRFKITQTVRDWHATASSNYGWILRNKRPTAPLGESQNMRFYATNWDNMQAVRPKLLITYETATAVNEPPEPTRLYTRGVSLNGRTLMAGTGFEHARIDVCTPNGARVLRTHIQDGRAVDLSALPAGVYLLRLVSKQSTLTFTVPLR